MIEILVTEPHILCAYGVCEWYLLNSRQYTILYSEHFVYIIVVVLCDLCPQNLWRHSEHGSLGTCDTVNLLCTLLWLCDASSLNSWQHSEHSGLCAHGVCAWQIFVEF